MTKYTPKPIDTTSIALPKELEELTEKLAENAHDHGNAQGDARAWVRNRKKGIKP